MNEAIVATTDGLIRPLYEGPLDIVGDVHGEIDALHDLLARLGYYRDGGHAAGRRLIFVGDLCDRGPDSAAVIDLVRSLVTAGRAQCVVGNHELNLLRGERKHGNHWFYRDDDAEHLQRFGPCVMATRGQQEAFLDFFASLPLALERSDLRVVHAAWHEPSVERCRDASGDVLAAYRHFEAALSRSEEGARLKAAHDAQRVQQQGVLRSIDTPPLLADIAAYEAYYQTGNPVRVLTSGLEQATRAVFHAGGRWRFVERVPWWRDYDAPQTVVFGHYWRWWHPASHASYNKGEPNLFIDTAACGWHNNAWGREFACCVDYSVGARFKERQEGRAGGFHGRLAALARARDRLRPRPAFDLSHRRTCHRSRSRLRHPRITRLLPKLIIRGRLPRRVV